MADIPGAVRFGQVVGRFVRFVADTGADPGEAPDEVPMAGSIVLTPLTRFIRFAGTTPPRLAVADVVTCTLDESGDLHTSGGPVHLIATDQPDGEPNLVQWRATFVFDKVDVQPSPVTFNVPAGGVVDLALILTVPPKPPELMVIDTTSLAQARQSAAEAAQSATQAALSADELQQALLHPPPLEGRLEVISSSTVDLTTEGCGTNDEPMVITGTMRPGTLLDRLQVADSPSLTLTLDGSGTVDDPAVITGEVIAQPDPNAELIAANAQAIQNLVADVGAMFNRLNDIDNHVNVNAANLNNIGERLTILENG